MDAYVINLDKRSDRWEQFQRDWNSITDIKPIRFSAIQHRNGGVGCTRSHLALVQYAKDNNMPCILVLEDDAVPTEQFKTLWKKCIKYLDEHPGWEVFNGGANVVYKRYIKRLTNTFYKTDTALGTHFIIYHQSCYDKVLSWESLPQNLDDRPVIDEFLSYPHLSLTFYGVCPYISIQHPGYSDIEKKERDREPIYERMQSLITKILKTN